MLELLGMLRWSHYSGISTSRGYNFPVILHFKGLRMKYFDNRIVHMIMNQSGDFEFISDE